jgi:hypothetical protein
LLARLNADDWSLAGDRSGSRPFFEPWFEMPWDNPAHLWWALLHSFAVKKSEIKRPLSIKIPTEPLF